MAAALVSEAAAVARAQGVKLPDGIEQTWLGRFKSFPGAMYSSMCHDIARGGQLEVEVDVCPDILCAMAGDRACRPACRPPSCRAECRAEATRERDADDPVKLGVRRLRRQSGSQRLD